MCPFVTERPASSCGALDQEADRRMGTLYLPDRKGAMLPPEVSNLKGSLLPGEGRVALSLLARITESGGADISDQFNIRVSYTLTNTDNQITLTGQGNLPTLQAQLSATIYVDRAQTTPTVTLSQQTVTGTFDFTPGIGIVAHEGIYLDQAFNSTLQSLQSLPNIIWFDYNDGAPIAITSNTTFNTSNGNLSSTDYEIVNQSELDELDWITVNEDVASNTFNVSMQYSSTLPSSLTAVPVLFRNKHTHRVVSGSVILQP